ncbi:MAG: metal-dependent hydrolase [Schwartzia sp.]|nr:metal-dependent hydrolase [Schwartzia sp. (in: firmicutes)]
MKWISHEVVTGVLVYTVTEDLTLTVCAMAGAVIPDRLDGDPRKAKDYWLWRGSHRGWSHWPAPYLFVIAAVLSAEQGMENGDSGRWMLIPVAVMAGALLHILEDALCGKVPLIFPGEKIGLKLFPVGSFREYFFALGIVLAAYGIKLLYGS